MFQDFTVLFESLKYFSTQTPPKCYFSYLVENNVHTNILIYLILWTELMAISVIWNSECLDDALIISIDKVGKRYATTITFSLNTFDMINTGVYAIFEHRLLIHIWFFMKFALNEMSPMNLKCSLLVSTSMSLV